MLSKERIEAAVAEIDANPTMWGQGILSPNAAKTALAALDLAERFRWRDPQEELPEDGHVVWAAVKIAYNDREFIACREASYLEGWRIDSHLGDATVIAWMPLPEWKGKAK